eukprot:15435994-Alexandrium_andersonii.AAC.1
MIYRGRRCLSTAHRLPLVTGSEPQTRLVRPAGLLRSQSHPCGCVASFLNSRKDVEPHLLEHVRMWVKPVQLGFSRCIGRATMANSPRGQVTPWDTLHRVSPGPPQSRTQTSAIPSARPLRSASSGCAKDTFAHRTALVWGAALRRPD